MHYSHGKLLGGKNDLIDAKRIALYGYRLKDEIKPTNIQSSEISSLKSLMTLRKQLMKQRSAYKTTMKEQMSIFKKKDFKIIFSIQEKMIKYLSKQLEIVDLKMEQIIQDNIELNNNFKLAKSVKCVGNQMAIILIITTDNFTKFETWRKFASYAGIAPFPNQSGTSIRGKTKVSHLANKDVKKAIHLCALSAIRYNPEMRRYYLKRIENGKNKMSTVNILRNKLIARVFAAVKRQTPYVDTMKFVS